MEKQKLKQTWRQRWLPTPDDAQEAADYLDKGSEYFIWHMTKRYARTLFLGVAALIGSCGGIGNNIEYSRGERVGMVNKLSEKGLFWKTWEGQMALEGIVSSNNTMGANVWDFSLDREAWNGEDTKELVAKLRGYMQNGAKVKLTYKEPLATWPWRSGTDYLIQSVEPVGERQ